MEAIKFLIVTAIVMAPIAVLTLEVCQAWRIWRNAAPLDGWRIFVLMHVPSLMTFAVYLTELVALLILSAIVRSEVPRWKEVLFLATIAILAAGIIFFRFWFYRRLRHR